MEWQVNPGTNFTVMNKGILILLSVIGFVCEIKAQVYNPDYPVIEEFEVEVGTINDQVKDYTTDKLTVEGGTVKLPSTFYYHDGRSLGMLIVHDNTDNFMAFDLRCPNCERKGKTGKFSMVTCLTAGCDTCTAEAQEIVMWGSGQLTGYEFRHSPDELYQFPVDEVERNGKLYLRITPSLASIP